MAREFWTKGEVRGGVDTIYEDIMLKTGTLVLMFIPAVKVHPRILPGTTRKRGRDDDPAEEEKEDNGTNGSGAIYFDRIDRRVVQFQLHWFPLHLRKELVLEWLKRYGTAIQLEEEVMEYEWLKLKTGALKAS